MKIVNKLVGLHKDAKYSGTSSMLNKLEACEIGLVTERQGKN